MMKPKIKREWVKALRGGRYKQTRNLLYDGQAYCCLGVLCRVVGATYREGAFWWEGDCDGGILPGKLRRELQITPRQEARLTSLNDGDAKGGPKSFKEIADYIQAKL
jgi:hypothetical protein